MEKKVVYITANTPLGQGEEFVLNEMLALKKTGMNLVIIPRDISSPPFHKEAFPLLEDTLSVPYFNLQIAKTLLNFVRAKPVVFLKLVSDIAMTARNLKIGLKNLILLAKAIYLSGILKEEFVRHVHAHWGSTTSTMAYVISKITGIPWSLTLHRWDIYDNNLLRKKAKSALFVRCISCKGKADLLQIIGEEFAPKVKVIHVGVEVPNLVNFARKPDNSRNKTWTIIVPANLKAVKGHKYLIDACSSLFRRRVFNFKCVFYGQGPLKKELQKYIERKGLSKFVSLAGAIPHERLLGLYEVREVDIVVLSSITTEDGSFEGIPVSLMEAMAYKIPVISTNTGGISELVGDGSGVLVEQRDNESMALAIERLMNNSGYYDLIGRRGRQKVEEDFSLSKISEELSALLTAS